MNTKTELPQHSWGSLKGNVSLKAHVSLKQLASRNFMLSLLLFVVLIAIISFAAWRDSANMNQLVEVYDDQFRVGQFKASIADVMLPINDFTMTADTNNFAKIRQAIDVFTARYENIKSIAHLSAGDIESLDQMNSLMGEVLRIASDVADGKIAPDQAPQVAVIAQNLVLSAQLKLESIVQGMETQLQTKSTQRQAQSSLQLYILLGFIVLIILLLELLNRKLVAHAQTVSKVSTDVVESAGDIIEVNKMQAGITEQQSRFMDKIIKGLELIAISGAKLPIATSKLEKNSSVISSFAKGGVSEVGVTLESINTVRTSMQTSTSKTASIADKIEHMLQTLAQIQDVADEANLLALNASIDGGASMTHEVQRMADQIRTYTDDIRAAIQAVSSVSSDAVGAAKSSIGDIDQSLEMIQSTLDVLSRIENLSDNNGQSATVIVKAIELQNARSQKILQVLRHISKLLHSSDNKLQAYKDASSRLTEASESLQHMT